MVENTEAGSEPLPRSGTVTRRGLLGGGLAAGLLVGLPIPPGSGAKTGGSSVTSQAAGRRGAAGSPPAGVEGNRGRAAVAIPAGAGTTLVVEALPFRLVLVGPHGDVVATPPGLAGDPLAAPGLDGPEPLSPLGAAGSFAPLGFVVAAQGGIEFPTSYWTGNRLFGAHAGAVVSAVSVSAVKRMGATTVVSLATDAPAFGPAFLSLTPLREGGVRLDVAPPAHLGSSATMFTLVSPAGEGLYGLGGRKDAFDQRGLLRNVWTEEENVGPGPLAPVTDPVLGPTYTFPNGPQGAYYVQALLLGSRGWATWIGQSVLSRLDLAASRPTLVRFSVASPVLTWFVAGGGIEEASKAFTAVAGRAPAPPRYAYLPWMDVINQQGEGDADPNGAGFSGGAAVAARAREIASKSVELDIPVGVIGMEGWQAVPDVAELASSLRAAGFRLSAYWNPFIGANTPAYSEAMASGFLVRDATGEPFPLIDNRESVTYLVDFSNPAASAWWATQLDRSMELGFEAFMHDFGEEVISGMMFHDGQPPSVEHNAYPVQYHRAARSAVDAWAATHQGFEPFFYGRSGYSNLGMTPGVVGSTSGVFPGDETTDWGPASGLASVVPAMLNLSLGGAYTFTTDVGGYFDLYTPQTSPELFTRWAQLAAFTAVSRVHNSTIHGSVYPWDLGAAVIDTYRRYARAKVRLVPLVDAWSHNAATIGDIGPVRPVVLDDPAATSVDDQWLLGHDLLVAPVLVEGATSRSVYLPAGSDWQQVVVGTDGSLVPIGRRTPGGETVSAPAPLTDIPVFVRQH